MSSTNPKLSENFGTLTVNGEGERGNLYLSCARCTSTLFPKLCHFGLILAFSATARDLLLGWARYDGNHGFAADGNTRVSRLLCLPRDG